MAFFFNREKPELKEEMRMRFCAPSFSFSMGEVLDIWSLAELKKNTAAIRGKVVILHPGLNVMLSPRHWMREFSCAYYLIICGDGDDRYIRKLKTEADKVVYGLVAKSLTGVSLCPTAEDAKTVVEAVLDGSGRAAVTVNSTEGEI